LCSAFGIEVGQEAAAEALAFAWEHWERIRSTDNPAGYLYGVGRNKARGSTRRRHPVLPAVPPGRLPWIEPALPAALARLSERQRTVVMLLYSFDWSMGEVAEWLGMARGTVQLHARRALFKLRRDLGVEK
jgi:DNA-directed RNA polymerase specialized sigma24 family protein